MSHAGQFWLSGFQIPSDLARIGDLRASRRPVARTDYASGLMAAKNVAKPVTGTRSRGSTVTLAMPPTASRGLGLRGTRHREPNPNSLGAVGSGDLAVGRARGEAWVRIIKLALANHPRNNVRTAENAALPDALCSLYFGGLDGLRPGGRPMNALKKIPSRIRSVRILNLSRLFSVAHSR